MNTKSTFQPQELQYLQLLAKQYPTVQAASTEIINLQAILGLPKGTEHFISDIHGEYEAFLHILNSCSGVVKEKLDELFGTTMTRAERDQLATLIYYPEEKLKLEIAAEIGVYDKVIRGGWRCLSAKESGRIGGMMTKKKRELKKS